MRHIVICCLSGPTKITTLSHKRRDFLEKELLNIKYVDLFSLQLSSEHAYPHLVCSEVGAGVLDKVLVFQSGSGCSGVGAGVLEWVRVFWIRCECSGIGACFMEWVWVFWSKCGYSG